MMTSTFSIDEEVGLFIDKKNIGLHNKSAAIEYALLWKLQMFKKILLILYTLMEQAQSFQVKITRKIR